MTRTAAVLTYRERSIVELVATGIKNAEIARILQTTEHVVKNCIRAIYDKLGLWNRVELALWYEARRSEANASLARLGRSLD
jgi:DNA-binding NarL/FixJ family response regulator